MAFAVAMHAETPPRLTGCGPLELESSLMETPSSTGPNTGLTVWEAKERAGLLALETDEWRDKRRIAEDPNTTAETLTQLSDEAHQVVEEGEYDDETSARRSVTLLAEALLAHPNTSPRSLQTLIELALPRGANALCRNPITPFLVLETPDFWWRLDYGACEGLLREASCPPSIVSILRNHENHFVAQAARRHISQAPPLLTPHEGCAALSRYWYDYCVQQTQNPDWSFASDYAGEWHAEMVELGLAPSWMSAFFGQTPPVAPPPPAYVAEWYASKEAEAGPPLPLPKKSKQSQKPHPYPALNKMYKRARRVFPNSALAKADGIAKLTVLLRPDASSDDLMQAAQMPDDGHEGVLRQIVLSHPKVTVDVLRYFAHNDLVADIRLRLAVHPLTPPDVLMMIVDEPVQRGGSSTIDALTRRLACRHPNAPDDLVDHARQTFLGATEPPDGFIGYPLIRFITGLRHAGFAQHLADRSRTIGWLGALYAALYLPLSDAPLANDFWNRSPLDLLHHLARDGNRLVRWAAQTRLADPDFVFTWHEGNE